MWRLSRGSGKGGGGSVLPCRAGGRAAFCMVGRVSWEGDRIHGEGACDDGVLVTTGCSDVKVGNVYSHSGFRLSVVGNGS